jgi:hypothetical protein
MIFVISEMKEASEVVALQVEVSEVLTLHDLTIACDDGRYTDACDMIDAAPHMESSF